MQEGQELLIIIYTVVGGLGGVNKYYVAVVDSGTRILYKQYIIKMLNLTQMLKMTFDTQSPVGIFNISMRVLTVKMSHVHSDYKFVPGPIVSDYPQEC